MPAYAQNPANYLGTTIAAAQNTARAGVKQSTQYVVNPKEPEQCEAIVGAIGYEYKGEPTGLKTGTAEVYGIAVFMGGKWRQVSESITWHEPSLEHSWANTSAAVAQYAKDSFGFVHCRGRIGSGTSGTQAFVFPEHFRPGNNTGDYYALVNAGTILVAAVVSPSGSVELFSNAGGVITDVSLSGLTFYAEN